MKIKSLSLGVLIVLMAGSGVLHLVKPEPYVKIVPRALPLPGTIVFLSGIAEIGLAFLLATPRARRAGAWMLMLFLVAVFPANIQMALDAEPATAKWWISVVRLPIQPLLIYWAYTFARRAGGPESG